MLFSVIRVNYSSKYCFSVLIAHFYSYRGNNPDKDIFIF